MNTEYLEYFKSPTAFAEFALLHTDGETRQRLLGVTHLHYSEKDLADRWFAEFIPLLNQMSMDACLEADRMHAEMIAR